MTGLLLDSVAVESTIDRLLRGSGAKGDVGVGGHEAG
jgi:hypothetical protein